MKATSPRAIRTNTTNHNPVQTQNPVPNGLGFYLPMLGAEEGIKDEGVGWFLAQAINCLETELLKIVIKDHAGDFYTIAFYGEILKLAHLYDQDLENINMEIPGVTMVKNYSAAQIALGFASLLYNHRDRIRSHLDDAPSNSEDRILMADALAVAMTVYARSNSVAEYEAYVSCKAPAPWPLQYAWQVKAEFYIAQQEAA